MKRTVRIACHVSLWLLALAIPGNALAQWSYQVDLAGSYDTNALGLKGSSAGAFLSASAGAAYVGPTVGAGYRARITGYDRTTELSSYLHQGHFNIGSSETTFSGLVEQRVGTQSDLYDYLVLRSVAQHRFDCSGFKCTLSATGSLFRFDQLTDRNQGNVVASLSASRSFETRTSIIASAGTGYTYYTDLTFEDTDPLQDSDVAQLMLNLRLAQSLSATTGIAAYYRQRTIHGATSIAFVDQESGISYALLDDPSLYSNRVIGLELTQMLSDYAISVKLGGSYADRDYPSQGIYLESGDYDTESLREDQYATAWLLATWRIPSGRHNLSLELAAQWSNNTSNSYWYDFSSSYLSLGLSYGL